MNEPDAISKHDFLYPRASYRGTFTPNLLIFNANLQEFSQQVGYIAGLHAAGKIPSAESYARIRKLWKALKNSKKAMLDEKSAF